MTIGTPKIIPVGTTCAPNVNASASLRHPIAMSNGPWPDPKNKRGHTMFEVAGVRYRVEGTGHSYDQLTRSIKNGLAAIVSGDDGGKGEK